MDIDATTGVRRRSGGAWVTAANVYRRAGGAWVKVWPAVALSASSSPNPVDVARTTTGGLTGTVTITPVGGSGSYTYSTTWLSGGASITLSLDDTATPGYSSSASPETVRTGTMRTVVNDGLTSVNVDTPVTLTWSTM